MAKKIQTTIKLQLPAGKATPAPPVGTALGPHGLNIMDFCKQFKAKTAKKPGGRIFPGAGYGLYGPHLHLYFEDAASFDFAAARRGHREGFRGAESQQSRQSYEEASRRDGQDQAGVSEHHEYRISV